jgi:DNA-binding response OmpR family regulator
MGYKILIVEDEAEITSLISNRLDTKSYDISIAMDGDAGLNLIKTENFDLAILDIMLPKVDGLTLCNELRNKNKKSLIMIVSALNLDESKERAYSLGADDYITKPFSPKLLALKVDSLLKRRFELSNLQLKSNKIIKHDDNLKRFYIQDKQLPLTPSEYLIFQTLFNNPKKVFSKEELSQILYDNDIGDIDKEGIRTHIYTLRKKIAQYSDDEIVKTLRNIGFTLYEN